MGRFALGTLIVYVALTFGVLILASQLLAAAYFEPSSRKPRRCRP